MKLSKIDNMRIKIIISLVILAVALLGCARQPATMDDIKDKTSNNKDLDWKDIELEDIKTGKKFKISDFKNKPILLETFAVWCPTCKKQQDQIKKLHNKIGDDVISISVAIDPTENKDIIKEHFDRYGYDWFFAVDKSDFSKKLVDEFGINVVNAPSAPIVLICEDQKTRLLKFGVKSIDFLEDEIIKGCP